MNRVPNCKRIKILFVYSNTVVKLFLQHGIKMASIYHVIANQKYICCLRSKKQS